MAAVLATSSHSVLSHRSAAALWGIRQTTRTRIEVTAPTRHRSRGSIQVHQVTLQDDEITTHRGIPISTVPRTLLDLASVLSPRDVERAVNEAEVLRLFDALSLEDMVVRHRGRPGVPTIRSILEEGKIAAAITREELEHLFITFVDRAGLPRPETNAVNEVGERGFEVDCLWRAQRLVVELDGRATHGTREAFEADRERDRILQTAGWRVIRITWRQLRHQPDLIAADLQALLFGRSSLPPP